MQGLTGDNSKQQHILELLQVNQGLFSGLSHGLGGALGQLQVGGVADLQAQAKLEEATRAEARAQRLRREAEGGGPVKTAPFKTGSTHIAIAYHIYFHKDKPGRNADEGKEEAPVPLEAARSCEPQDVAKRSEIENLTESQINEIQNRLRLGETQKEEII